MVNFNIVEGDVSDAFRDEFVELYYDRSLNMNQICEKLDISSRKYGRIKKELVDAGRIDGEFRCFRHKGKGKYYVKNKRYGTYSISRKFKGKQVYYLTVPTEEEAKACVEMLEEHNWNKKSVPLIREKLMELYG